MRIAYLDCIGGISGDMFVGALLDAGWPEAELRRTVAWLGDEIADLTVERRRHHALAGMGIQVTPARPAAPEQRDLQHMLAILDRAPLPGPVRASACHVFTRLAQAEARAHGVAIEAIHFHEVGAVDALVDIVGTCAGLVGLGIERLYVSSLPFAGGTIQAAHGPLPLPSPAAAFLAEGLAVRWIDGSGERCTPTGTALVAELCAPGCPTMMRVTGVGTGAGSQSFDDVPNLARLFIGESIASGGVACEGRAAAPAGVATGGHDLPEWGWSSEGEAGESAPSPGSWGRVAVLETHIDDSTPEEVAWLCETLRRSGALDVLVAPAFTKKARMASQLTVISRPEREADLIAQLLSLSSTLGVRRRLEWRRELTRRQGVVETELGPIEVKYALRGTLGWVGEPEYESCRAVAEKSSAPLALVRREALAALARRAAENEDSEAP